jgi:hypothetical protein
LVVENLGEENGCAFLWPAHWMDFVKTVKDLDRMERLLQARLDEANQQMEAIRLTRLMLATNAQATGNGNGERRACCTVSRDVRATVRGFGEPFRICDVNAALERAGKTYKPVSVLAVIMRMVHQNRVRLFKPRQGAIGAVYENV